MKILKSFLFAWNGCKICFASGTNFKIHIVFATAAILLGGAFAITPAEWMMIMGCTGFVIAMEMLNTAIEQLCDMLHKEFHPSIKRIKDIAAGAVLVSAIGSAVIGCIIFLPKIILFIKSF